MNKILFLDFDGVLNTIKYLASVRNSALRCKEYWENPDFKKKAEDYHWIKMIDPKKVALLNKIIEATQCEVVVSSTWRILNSKEELQKYLDAQGFCGKVIDVTPQSLKGFRPREIEMWLNHEITDNGMLIESIVVIDDDALKNSCSMIAL